ncbi:UNVERIFIED_CONTAM: hypothetical protein Sradi_0945900 [Sesamum radiatum]|uniref:Uncharacterized protein n=1 Tax=Sesamum radiatum TaxID=300843 RepID=A0AAW2V7G1_SESRA
MSAKRIRTESRFARYMRGPVKALARARDLYVRSLSGCADHVHCADSMGFPAPHFESLPRSFSTNSSYSKDEDLKELVRIASTRSLPEKWRRSSTVPENRRRWHAAARWSLAGSMKRSRVNLEKISTERDRGFIRGVEVM